MYNYKLNEEDLAELMLYQMGKNKDMKFFLNGCIAVFSIALVSVWLYVIKRLQPDINIGVMIAADVIISLLIMVAIIKSYRKLLPFIYRRDVNKNSDKYDLTIEFYVNKLKVFRKESEEEFLKDDIRCEEVDNALYVFSRKRILIIPERIFKTEEDKRKVYDGLKAVSY